MKQFKIKRLLISTFTICFVLYFLKLFVGDFHTVHSSGMLGSLKQGDRVFISKLNTGTRTPITPLEIPFSDWITGKSIYSELLKLEPFSFPKLYESYYTQLIAFNQPSRAHTAIDRKPVYTGRLYGLPGDTISLKNNEIIIGENLMTNPSSINWPYKVKVTDKFQEKLLPQLGIELYIKNTKTTYAALMSKDQASILMNVPGVRYAKPIYNSNLINDSLELFGNKQWTLFKYGPIHIPAKGQEIEINFRNIEDYLYLLENYEKLIVSIDKNKVFINGEEVERYTFKQNYYFILGDNRASTIDSRHFGPVPESHIIGQPSLVAYSLRPNRESFLESIRIDRTFLLIE